MKSTVTEKQTKPSLWHLFAKGFPLKTRGHADVPDSQSVTVKWDLEKAKKAEASREYLRAGTYLDTTSGEKVKNPSSASVKLPAQGYKQIVEGMKNVNAIGGRKPKTLFLSYVPVEWFVEKLAFLNGKSGVIAKKFRDYDTFKEDLEAKSVQLEDMKGYHFPIRMTGPTGAVQGALRAFGLDFGRVADYAGVSNLIGGGKLLAGRYNEFNVEMIDTFAFHGDDLLRDSNGKIVQIDSNVGFEDWEANHVYGSVWINEHASTREERKFFRIRGQDGNEMRLMDFVFVANAFSRGDVSKKYIDDNLFYVQNSAGKFVPLGDAKMAAPSESGKFMISLPLILESLKSKTDKFGDQTITQDSISLKLDAKGNFKLGHKAKRARVMAPSQIEYAIVPPFSYTAKGNTDVTTEEYDIVIAVSPSTKATSEDACKLKKPKAEPVVHDPRAVVAALVASLKIQSNVNPSAEVIGAVLNEQITSLLLKKKEKEVKKKVKAGPVNSSNWGDDDEDEEPEPEVDEENPREVEMPQ